MMKIKLALATVKVAGISVFSQEIKIKKGELFLNDKVVAKVESKKNVYSFSDLNGKLQFTAKTISADQNEKGWIEFTGENGNVKKAGYADAGFTLNLGKLLVQNALSQGFLTKDGIDEEKVKEFFQTTDRSLIQNREDSQKMQQEITDKEDILANEMGIAIDNSGKIWNKNKELQGYIQRVNTGNQTIVLNYEYRVYDINKIQIAKLQCTNSDTFNSKNGLIITPMIINKLTFL